MTKYLSSVKDLIDEAADRLDGLGLASDSEDDGALDNGHGLLGSLKQVKNKKKKKKNKPKPEDIFTSNSDETAQSFEDMDLSAGLLKAIYRQGMEKPSFVQQKGIVPCVTGRDSVIQGQSGMGKTACFVIGSIARLQLLKASESQSESKGQGPCQVPLSSSIYSPALARNQNQLEASPAGCKVLILVPTRELALQINEFVQRVISTLGFTSCTCIGGRRTSIDVDRLYRGVDIVVGTPGRILHLIEEEEVIVPEKLKILILDEADELLKTRITRRSRGRGTFSFVAVGKILSLLKSSSIQKILTSATIPEDMLRVVQPYLNDPFKIIVRSEELTLEGINQYHLPLGAEEFKMSTLLDLYSQIQTIPTIIFCNKRDKVDSISKGLIEKGITNYLTAHGMMGQGQRERILRDFRYGKSKILISSDLFGRGIDVQQVQLVINYDFPPNTEQYIHRVGRGGRFGRKGIAITFIAGEAEMEKIKAIEQVYETEIKVLPINALKSLS